MPCGYASSATLLLRCATRKVKSSFVCLLQIKTYILNMMTTQWCNKELRFACQKNSGSACKEFCSPLTHTLFQRYMSFCIQLFQRDHTVGHFDENDIFRKRRQKDLNYQRENLCLPYFMKRGDWKRFFKRAWTANISQHGWHKQTISWSLQLHL